MRHDACEPSKTRVRDVLDQSGWTMGKLPLRSYLRRFRTAGQLRERDDVAAVYPETFRCAAD